MSIESRSTASPQLPYFSLVPFLLIALRPGVGDSGAVHPASRTDGRDVWRTDRTASPLLSRSVCASDRGFHCRRLPRRRWRPAAFSVPPVPVARLSRLVRFFAGRHSAAFPCRLRGEGQSLHRACAVRLVSGACRGHAVHGSQGPDRGVRLARTGAAAAAKEVRTHLGRADPWRHLGALARPGIPVERDAAKRLVVYAIFRWLDRDQRDPDGDVQRHARQHPAPCAVPLSVDQSPLARRTTLRHAVLRRRRVCDCLVQPGSPVRQRSRADGSHP
jgi:hypothetical protein